MFANEYRSKLRTPEEAVKVVKSGDWVFMSHFAMFPQTLDEALSKRVGEMTDVKIRCVCATVPPKVCTADPEKKTFTYMSGYLSGYERKLAEKGLVYYIPGNYSASPTYVRNGNSFPPDVAFIQTTPPDKNGYFNFGTSVSYARAITEMAKIVILEVNDQVPWVCGGEQETIHISQVDYIVEKSYPLPTIHAAKEPTEAEVAIANILINEIEDGSTLQFGIGGMPNTIAKMIADSDLKDLGIHSEMATTSYIDLILKGKVTGARKNIDKYKVVFTFAMGSKELYDFLDRNPAFASFPVDITNNPARIALNDKVITINNTVEVDLFGQISSESSGIRQISGTGGQLDFTMGATYSKGGKPFICMSSTTVQGGKTVSRLVPNIKQFSAVTCPRTFAPTIVTEFGKANLAGKSTFQRAEMLIELAHPDFREELIKAAQAQNIWTRTNKIPN